MKNGRLRRWRGRCLGAVSTAAAMTLAAGIGSTARIALALDWDPDTSTAGVQGGSGVWSASASNFNWNNGTSNVIWVNGQPAVFAGTGGTVTLDGVAGAIDVAALQFDSLGYLLTGDTLTLSGGTITTNANAQIASVLAGTNGLTKMGSGILMLSGVNSFSGAAAVNEGILRIDTDGALGASAVTVASGAQLLLNSSYSALPSVTSTGNVTVATGRNVTNTGGFQLNGGTFNINGDFTVAGGSTFAYNAGTISGTVKVGGGLVVFGGGSSGNFLFNSGSSTAIGTIPASMHVQIQQAASAGALTVSTTGLVNNGTITVSSLQSGGNVTLNPGGTGMTNNGTININPGTASEGTRSLTGIFENSATGVINVNASASGIAGGTINNSGIVSVAPLQTLALTAFFQNAGTLDISGTLRSTQFTYNGGQINGPVTVGSTGGPGNLTLNSPTGGGTFILNNGGTINGNIPANTSVTVQAVATFPTTNSLTLNGASWTNNGSLTIGSINANSSLTINNSLTNNGTLTVSPGPTSDGGRSFTGSITNLGQFNINTTTGVAGSWSNSGALSIAPTKNLTVGTFVQSAGLVSIGGSLNSSSFTYNGGQVAGTVNLGLPGFNSANLTLGPSAGAGTFVFSSSSTSFLSGNIPASMTVMLQPNQSFSTTSTLFVSGGAAGGPMLNNGTFILSALNAGHSLGISGSITNNGVIQVNPGPISQFSGEGSRSFGGSITNSGLININAPTFVFGSLSNSGTVSVASGRSLLLSGSFFLTSGSLAAAGTVTTPTFSYTGGQVSGTVNVSGFSPMLTLGPSAGAGTFLIVPSSSSANLDGNIPANMTVILQPGPSTFTQSVSLSLFGPLGAVSNAGNFVLSSVNANHAITVSGSGINNSGTFTIDPGPFGDAPRTLTTTMSNSGSFNVNASTFATGITNTGTINISAGRLLSIMGTSLSQSSGLTSISGTLSSRSTNISGGTITVSPTGTFSTNTLTQSGGTIQGTVYIPAPGLLGGAGANISPSMQVVLQPTFSGLGSYSFPSALTNNGSLSLSTVLATSSINVGGTGTMTNNGTVSFNNSNTLDVGRTFSGTILNQSAGTIQMNSGGTIGTVTNSGLVNVPAFKQLSTTTFNQQSGTLALGGTLATLNFNNTGGTISGGGTVIITNGGNVTLGASGSPANLLFRGGGLLTGTPSASAFVVVSPETGIDTVYTLSTATSLTNNTTMSLASVVGESQVELRIGDGTSTLTNAAVISTSTGTAPGAGRSVAIAGVVNNIASGSININGVTSATSIQNSGVLAVHSRTLTVSGNLTQNATGVISVAPGAELNAPVIFPSSNGITLSGDAFTPGIMSTPGVTFSGSTGTVQITSAPAAGEVPGRLVLGAASAPFDIANGSAAIDMEIPIPVGGTGGLNKTGSGTLRLSGNNSYTGVATVSAGTLLVAGNASLGAPTSGIAINGGTLKTEGPITGTRNLTLGGASGVLDHGAFAVSLGNVDGTGNLTKLGSGTLTADHLRTGFLHITGGRAVVRPSGGAAGFSVMGDLVLDAGTALDLNDNDLAIAYSGPSIFTDIRQLVTTGFRGAPDPAATGIVSGTSQANGGQTILALFDNALVGATDWLGVPIPTNSVVGKYTYFGDANIDGQVSGDDYTVLDANLNTTPPVGLGWLSGDMNVDGAVTGDDYTVIDANLGKGASNPLSPSALGPGASAVPEPSSALAVLAGALLLPRRKRRIAAR